MPKSDTSDMRGVTASCGPSVDPDKDRRDGRGRGPRFEVPRTPATEGGNGVARFHGAAEDVRGRGDGLADLLFSDVARTRAVLAGVGVLTFGAGFVRRTGDFGRGGRARTGSLLASLGVPAGVLAALERAAGLPLGIGGVVGLPALRMDLDDADGRRAGLGRSGCATGRVVTALPVDAADNDGLLVALTTTLALFSAGAAGVGAADSVDCEDVVRTRVAADDVETTVLPTTGGRRGALIGLAPRVDVVLDVVALVLGLEETAVREVPDVRVLAMDAADACLFNGGSDGVGVAVLAAFALPVMRGRGGPLMMGDCRTGCLTGVGLLGPGAAEMDALLRDPTDTTVVFSAAPGLRG